MGYAQGKHEILARFLRSVRVRYIPPFLMENRLMVGQEALTLLVLVRIQLLHPIQWIIGRMIMRLVATQIK